MNDQPRPDPEIDEQDRDIAALVAGALRAELPPEVAQRHDALLRARAVGADIRMLSPRRKLRKLTVLAAAAVLVLAMSTIAVAADGSKPGDLLYPANRLVERVELALARSPEAKADVHLAHAFERIEAVEALKAAERHEHLPVAVAHAQESLQAAFDTVEGAGADRDELREHVVAMIAQHVERLQTVRDTLAAMDRVPAQALDALDLAIDAGSEIARAAVERGLERRPTVPGPPADPGEEGRPADTGRPEGVPAGPPQGSSGNAVEHGPPNEVPPGQQDPGTGPSGSNGSEHGPSDQPGPPQDTPPQGPPDDAPGGRP